MVDGLPWFISVLIIVGVVGTLLWDLLTSVIFKGLEWLFVRLGLTGQCRPYHIGNEQIASVIEPFALGAHGENAKGKVQFRGEVWNADCDPGLALDLKKGDTVKIRYNKGLTLTVERKLKG